MAGSPDRNYSYDRSGPPPIQTSYQAFQPSSQTYHDQRDVSPVESTNDLHFPIPAQHHSPPAPPVHRSTPVGSHPDSAYSRFQGQRNNVPQSPQNYSNYSPPGITPGADNLGERSAGGGINGIAIGVAGMNERESGAQAMRDVNGWGRNGDGSYASPRGVPAERNQGGTPFADHYGYEHPAQPRPIHSQPSYGSNAPLAAGAIAPSGMVSSSGSERSLPMNQSPHHAGYPYQDSPYNRYSSSNLDLAPQQMGAINPDYADDDDDWGMGPQPTAQQKRRSFVPFGSSRDGSREGTPGASSAALGAGAAGVAGAGAAAGAAGAGAPGPSMAARDASGTYSSVPGGSGPEAGAGPGPNEKSEWLASQNTGRRRLKWIVGTIIIIIIIGAVVGGVLGAVLNKDKNSGGNAGNGKTAEEEDKDVLSVNSQEIKKLMDNNAFHKVFPGMDYTPLNAQYPECIKTKPSQNNITRDVAVMSKLTNAIRLYGTDCNQTEMVLESIKRLKIEDDMKVWLGVWLGDNKTTNSRQIEQMWKLIDDHGAKPFKGIILGNEVLFREELTEQELMDEVEEVHGKLLKKGIDLPIATSDLGNNWNEEMAKKVNVVMSNVHPFFSGVEASKGAGWTWEFWTGHDVALTASNSSIKQIVAEVGWPSGGGNSCGESDCTSKTQGSVAGVKEMNLFMKDYICQSLKNGTEFFWFSAFDEPWKIRYNEKGKEWEDKWGLMDVNRKLKDGVEIPDCGGDSIK